MPALSPEQANMIILLHFFTLYTGYPCQIVSLTKSPLLHFLVCLKTDPLIFLTCFRSTPLLGNYAPVLTIAFYDRITLGLKLVRGHSLFKLQLCGTNSHTPLDTQIQSLLSKLN